MKIWKQNALDMALTTNKSWRQIARELGKPKSSVSDFLREALKEDGLQEVMTKESAPKVLFLDIESSMLKTYTWGLWKQNISLPQIIEDWYMLCYSAKWQGDYPVLHDSLHFHPLKNGRYKYNEYLLIQSIWELLNEADVVVAYNGKKFDKRKINAKFLEYGMLEPSPYKIVDPYLIVRENFALTSNKLDYVTKLLDGEGKLITNINLWIRAMEDDYSALEEMSLYCDNDVTELEDVYNKVKHWDKRAPNMALYYNDDKVRCNTCGSEDLKLLDTTANTQVSAFSVYRCGCCGKVLRDRKNTLTKEKRSTLFMNVQ